MQTFAALQPDLHQVPLTDPDCGDLFAQTKDSFLSPHVITQGFHDLVIHKVQHSGPLVDYGHSDAERRQHRGVLKSDHAGPDHDQLARDAVHLTDLIRVDHAIAKRDLRRARRSRAGGNQDEVCLHELRGLFPFNLQSMRIPKASSTVDHSDSVASELLTDDGRLSGDNSIHALHQIGDADLLFEFVIATVKGTLAIAGQVEHGFAERLAGYGAGVQGHTSRHLTAVNHRHAFTQFGRSNRALLTGRAAADDDQIKMIFTRGHVL